MTPFICQILYRKVYRISRRSTSTDIQENSILYKKTAKILAAAEGGIMHWMSQVTVAAAKNKFSKL
ncbi:MAG: hypothetical protein KH295_12980 [Clostridiaceae bacterium]|nr:hypothetical protein [Clostridiaceae bacterium]